MKCKSFLRIAESSLTVVVLLTATGCSLLSNNNMPYFSGEGKCPLCGTVVTKHPVEVQTSTVDKSFLNELLNKDYSLKNYLPEEPKPMVWVDDSINWTADEVTPDLNVSKGKDGVKYLPCKSIFDSSHNDVFFYYITDAVGKPGPLKMRLQYYADDPLNFKDMEFIIDGFEYKFHPTNVQRGKATGVMIWEASDDEIKAADKDLAYALSHCTWARLKLIGASGINHVKVISEDQLKGFKRVMQMYLLQGGTIN